MVDVLACAVVEDDADDCGRDVVSQLLAGAIADGRCFLFWRTRTLNHGSTNTIRYACTQQALPLPCGGGVPTTCLDN
eukprot:8759980-Lingulodinium_polyedra.AAC.1